ncbi:MAG: nicotinamide riboside transporter PnuC [Lachnospiraceae bacterium]|nr:nicotinamide riboside transporter PnuC [Lachnospiraceae bacterium]
MNNPITNFTKREWILWISSLTAIILTNIFSESFDLLTFFASCIGVTSLVFAAIGNVWSQVLMVIFSILYGMISFQFHYWGEMITYLGMTMPMAIWSTFTWLKNPAKNGKEVKIRRLQKKDLLLLIVSCIAVTFLFFIILDKLDTPNIFFSTLSISTSFLAAALTMLRSSYYALGYAANDIVLIVMWTLAAIQNPIYISVIVIFVIFFFNDMYGFISWKKRECKEAAHF